MANSKAPAVPHNPNAALHPELMKELKTRFSHPIVDSLEANVQDTANPELTTGDRQLIDCRDAFLMAGVRIAQQTEKGREQAVALTKLEEAFDWTIKSILRTPGYSFSAWTNNAPATAGAGVRNNEGWSPDTGVPGTIPPEHRSQR